MQFSTKLSVLITLLVTVAITSIIVSSMIIISSSSIDLYHQKWKDLSQKIDESLFSSSPEELNLWLPLVMTASDIEFIEVTKADESLLFLENFIDLSLWERIIALNEVTLSLPEHPQYQLTLTYLNSTLYNFFSAKIIGYLFLALLLITGILTLILGWVKGVFKGITLLERRAKKILMGQREETSKLNRPEWPKDVSKALDFLLLERKKRYKERTHVDTLIRTFVALDAQTGLRNRLSFEYQLTTLLEESNAHGIVMMVRLPDYDLIKPHGPTNIDELLETLINILSTFVMSYPSVIIARYFNNDFSILLPHTSSKESEYMALQLINSVDTLSLGTDIDRDRLMFIGISAYYYGQSPELIMNYAEQAVRTAELQGSNGWFVYDNNIPKVVLGSVRWRTLLERMLATTQGLRLYEEPSITIDGKVHHRSITCQLFDGEQELLAAEFMNWLREFKLIEQFDRKIVGKLSILLARWPSETITVTISVESLLNSSFNQWLFELLATKDRTFCQRLLFEMVESEVCQHLEELIPIVTALRRTGCRIGIVQAGLTVADTSYIEPLQIEIIKLYPGLARHIKMRPENQLIVESLCSACADVNVRIFATGIRTNSEWDVLCNKGIHGGQGTLFAIPERIPM